MLRNPSNQFSRIAGTKLAVSPAQLWYDCKVINVSGRPSLYHSSHLAKLQDLWDCFLLISMTDLFMILVWTIDIHFQQRISVIYLIISGEFKGYGFACFNSKVAALQARHVLEGQEVDGHVVDVGWLKEGVHQVTDLHSKVTTLVTIFVKITNLMWETCLGITESKPRINLTSLNFKIGIKFPSWQPLCGVSRIKSTFQFIYINNVFRENKQEQRLGEMFSNLQPWNISFNCVTFPFATKLLFVTFLMTNYFKSQYSVQVLYVDKLPVGFRDLAQFRSLFSRIVNPPYCQVSLWHAVHLG